MMATQGPDARTGRANRRVAMVCGSVALLMVGAAYAAVPLYDLFCRVTGFGGTTQRVEVLADRLLARLVTVRFDANVARGVPVRFKPKQRTIDVRLGEKTTATYLATNTSARPVTTTASFNVTPDIAGVYFNKLECFCFTEQTLAPGQTVEMPVVFYVDPDMADDNKLDRITTITLSYTFFMSDPAPVARTSGRSQSKENL